MRQLASFCDLCFVDGNLRLAVGRYRNDEGDWWDACSKHMRTVKENHPDWETDEYYEQGDVRDVPYE